MNNSLLSRISGFIQCRFKNRHKECCICSLDPRAMELSKQIEECGDFPRPPLFDPRAMELSATIAKLQEEKRKGTPS